MASQKLFSSYENRDWALTIVDMVLGPIGEQSSRPGVPVPSRILLIVWHNNCEATRNFET